MRSKPLKQKKALESENTFEGFLCTKRKGLNLGSRSETLTSNFYFRVQDLHCGFRAKGDLVC